MKVTDYRNVSKDEVTSRKFNPWIGISLGNKYFTQEHLADYIRSCLDIAQSGVLVVIADEPHSINYRVFESMPAQTALAKACRNSDKVDFLLREVISSLTIKEGKKIKVVRWGELACTDWYRERFKILEKIFRSDEDFKKNLIEIVRLNMGDRLEGLELSQIEELATYVLVELPIFVGDLKFDETVYDLHLYPGLSLMDEFILGLREGKIFPEVSLKIPAKQKLVILEAYAD